jgi:hypothetical protein
MSFDLPENANEIEGMGAVELPFIAPLIYWRSGNDALEHMQEIQGVQRFGGWAIQPDQIDPFPSLPELSMTFALTELSGSEGKYTNFLSRQIDVAVVARRFAWFDKSVTQYLAYMKNFGAVILQAKSTTGKDLDAAVSDFKKKSVDARWNASTASAVTEQFFFMSIGSFGDAPVFVKKTNARGDETRVTVPVILTPKEGFTAANIQYVGRDIAGEIVNMQKQAKAWLDDWNKRAKQKQAAPENELPPLPAEMAFP